MKQANKMKMMKTVIEYIGSGFGDGGAETLIKDYAILMKERGIRILILSLNSINYDSANYKTIHQHGIEILSIHDILYPADRPYLLNKLVNKLFKKKRIDYLLIKFIEINKPDAIHVHLNALWSLEPIWKRLKDIRLLYTCHSQPKIHLRKTKNYDEFQAAKTLIRECDLQMIALHRDMRNEINSMFSIDNTRIIWNGINLDRFLNNRVSKSTERESLGIAADRFVVLHVGTFNKAKNHPFIVKVFNEVQKMKENAFLLLVGNADSSETIEALNELGLAGKYMILSHRSDVPEILKAGDVFLFPSIYEGLPVSVVEAQISGLRCVVSECVTDDCLFYPTTIKMSLEESPRMWANVLLDESVTSSYDKNIDDFDMKNVISNLEHLYFD